MTGEEAAHPLNTPHRPVQGFVGVASGHEKADSLHPLCPSCELCDPENKETAFSLQIWVPLPLGQVAEQKKKKKETKDFSPSPPPGEGAVRSPPPGKARHLRDTSKPSLGSWCLPDEQAVSPSCGLLDTVGVICGGVGEAAASRHPLL